MATAKKIAEWSRCTPPDWDTETLHAAKTAYWVPGTEMVMRSGTKLRDDHCRMAVPIIRTQLAKAGKRLAWILNEIFR